MNSDWAVVPWYANADHYDFFRSTAIDAGDFFDSHEDWLIAALHHERMAERQGIAVVRIRMSPDTFQGWLRSTGSQNDAAGRSKFANLQAVRLLGGAPSPESQS